MTENKEMIKVESQDKSWDEALKTEAWIAPITNIYETDNHFHLTANLPGVERSDVKIKLEDSNLIIMGRIKFDDVSTRKYVLKEAETGNYYRKFRITDSIDESKIEAKFDNGQLNISLAKSDKMKTKIIDIG